MRNYAGTCKDICCYKLVYNFLMQLLSLQSSVFVVHFSNVFWHGNEAFPKGSFQNKIVPLLVIFHLLCSQYRGAKMCFHSCRYQNQNFSLVSHSCRTLVVRVTLVSLLSGTRVVKQTRSNKTAEWFDIYGIDNKLLNEYVIIAETFGYWI